MIIRIFLLALACILVLFGCTDKDEKDEKKEKESASRYVSPTTGLPVGKEASQHFSIMIENSPGARPQSGLSSADVVYELMTEGNITRYLAFFHDSIPSEIGPARSARHYFIPLAEAVRFPYIHFGGSPQAYARLKETAIPTIDGIKTESLYFMRDSSRNAPHNAYLLPDKLTDFDQNETIPFFTFGSSSKAGKGKIERVSFSYNDFTDIQYEWDASEKAYIRYQEDSPHVDRMTNEPIRANNIVLLQAKHERIDGDKKGRIDVDLTGDGDVTVISNGRLTKGTWHYKKGIIAYEDKKGKPIVFAKGKTWVQVVDFNQAVSVE